MEKKLKLAVMALCLAPSAFAQTEDNKQSEGQNAIASEQAFTFTEAQLGEDDDMSQNVTIISSNQNIYASQVGYLFSPVRFRYRAFNQKYNEIYINGAQMNDMESGQFRYSLVGGLNQQTRGVENALPFEVNNFAMSAMGGSNNYDFRPSHMPTGQRVTLSGANRNYTVRAMYTYNSGLLPSGWALSANVTYRWANMETSYVDGTFYNSISYFFGAEKKLNDHHAISLVTWGNPTERAGQGASTDEMYWLANDRYYNPYWGYQNGEKRTSRVVNDFAPTVLLTWDWNINNQTKLVTTLTGRYSMYKNTRLNYNNSEKPQADYWKNMPSSYYDVWYADDFTDRTDEGYMNFFRARNYMMSDKAHRQINWDQLYYVNAMGNQVGRDATYFVQAKHNDNLNLTLASTLKTELSKNSSMNLGFQLATNKGMHYQTMEDLLGANTFRNINTYALGTYPEGDRHIYYDMNNQGGQVKEGDRFGYDYNILVNKGSFWASYNHKFRNVNTFVAGRIGGVSMQRDGRMSNGMGWVEKDGQLVDNSFGKSGTARFLEGGAKAGLTARIARGHTATLGLGYELHAPQAQAAFVAPEVNNDFVMNLKNEKVFSSELGYQFETTWLKANISGYYSRLTDVTEWQNFYDDDARSFTYVSMTNIKKAYYGLEWGLNFKVTPSFNIKAIGTVSEAKNTNNSNVWYMSSTSAKLNEPNDGKIETVYNKDMREAGTPLTALNLTLSYHAHGWFIDLMGNYYDRIYLSYSPSYRYETTLNTRQSVWENNYGKRPAAEQVYEVAEDGSKHILPSAIEQAKGKGGFMLDLSIGRSVYLKKGSLSVNLMLTNVLNNQKLVTGGYEQSRSNYSVSDEGAVTSTRAYRFNRNPMKYYAYGINGMLNIAYKF